MITEERHGQLLTVPRAAQRIGMSVSYLRAEIRNKKIKYVRIGGRVLIPKSVIDNLISANTVEPVPSELTQ